MTQGGGADSLEAGVELLRDSTAVVELPRDSTAVVEQLIRPFRGC